MLAGDLNPYMWQDEVHGAWHWREPFASWPHHKYPTAGVGDLNVPVGTPCDWTLPQQPSNLPPPPWPHWMNTPPPWWTQPAPGSAADMESRIQVLEWKLSQLTAEVAKLQGK
jgi:hypothetical protein